MALGLAALFLVVQALGLVPTDRHIDGPAALVCSTAAFWYLEGARPSNLTVTLLALVMAAVFLIGPHEAMEGRWGALAEGQGPTQSHGGQNGGVPPRR